MDISWAFSDDRFMGNAAAALGFSAEGEVAVDGYTSNLDFSLAPSSYENSDPITPPAEFASATIVVHYIGRAAVALTAGNVSMSYGDLELTIARAFRLQATEIDVIHVIGYAYIEDVAALPHDDLTISITGVSNPNVVSGAYEALFVEGLDDAAPTVFSAGTEDTFVTPLELADVDDFEFVFTCAVQAGFSADSSTLTVTDDLGDLTQNAQLEESTSVVFSSATWAEDCTTSYDCDCDVDPDARTLAQMRVDTLSVSGYAANATNPGPGVNRMYNNFIDLAQKYVYSKVRAMNTARFFQWTLEPGVRYYGLQDTINCCQVLLNRYKIEGAWIKDLNNVWWPLVYGIDPTGYTLDTNFGWPTNFEVRSCIEVFPAPQAAYTLVIKAHYQLLPLVEDTDTTTIPSTPVLNWAIFLAKSHKGMKDAAIYSAMCNAQLDEMVAGRHVTRRYIPGTAEIPVPTPPIMVSFQN